MTMTHRTGLRPLLLLIALALVPLAGAAPEGAGAANDDMSPLEAWASGIWEAARTSQAGDFDAIENRLDALPEVEIATEPAERFRESLSLLRTNRVAAASAREEQRAEAIGKMRDEVAEGNLTLGLSEAIRAQTLAGDLDEAFQDDEIMELVRWAEDRVPLVTRERSWLEAQELLYLLRTFYDDTDRRSEFQRYDEELKAVNRRVGLLASYAPRQLHDMRNDRRKELGEDPLGEFNPATAIDLRDRLDGIDDRMLRAALGKAAHEHIETAGWRPLIEGGLEALQLLATTSALAETFPSLADPVRVNQWVRALDEHVSMLNLTPDQRLDRWTLLRLIDDLIQENEDTIALDNAVIFREFGDGAMNKLDPYSEVIWPDKLRRFEQATAGNFVGVGILIRHNDKREIMVVNPLEGTPAYYAGIKPGDLILEVDGKSTVGWSLNDAVDRITGPRGKKVKLGIGRDGVEGLLYIPVERDVIKIRSVKGWYKENLEEDGDPVWDWYIDPVSRIAFIRLTQFTSDSYGDLLAAWREIGRDGKPAGLILDLRHNPGGLLNSAVSICNLFLEGGNIVTCEDKDGRAALRRDAKRNRAQLADVPTVVLINRGSASASEIVAGCLQAHGAALVVGERTFGKGSVQTVHHISTGEALLKLTTQYYRLPPSQDDPAGRLVHKRPNAEVWGVDPDIVVPMPETQIGEALTLRQSAEMIPLDEEGNLNPSDPERANVNDLLTKGIDPQLETALLILQAQALAQHEQVRHASRQGG